MIKRLERSAKSIILIDILGDSLSRVNWNPNFQTDWEYADAPYVDLKDG
jgi:hypothetical protein